MNNNKNPLRLPQFIILISHIGYNKIDKNVYKISNDLNITYSHIVKLFKEFEKNDIIRVKKVGRTNNFYLTEKGKRLYKICSELKDCLHNRGD